MVLLLIIYLVAIVLSYTRAAWLSLILAFGVWIIIKLRIKWYYVIIGSGLLFILIYHQRTEILIRLSQNTQTSSGKFREHLQSISNISTDASNLERLNRWQCAIRMFKEKPFFGWGTGYLYVSICPFSEISAENKHFNQYRHLGNAHSEYLGPLSEQGLFGMGSILSVIILTIWSALRVLKESGSKKLKIFILSILIGLFTYYVHGIMNNFLDTDKALLFSGDSQPC